MNESIHHAEDVVAQALQKEADWCEANQTLRDAKVDARLVLQALRDADFAVMRKLPQDYVSKYPVFPGDHIDGLVGGESKCANTGADDG